MGMVTGYLVSMDRTMYVSNYFIIFVKHMELGLRLSHILFSVHPGVAFYKETELPALGRAL